MRKLVKIIIVIILIITTFGIFILNYLNKNKLDKFTEVVIEIEETENNKAVVTNEQEFVMALENNEIQIIELKSDIDLGYKLLKSNGIESKYITKHYEPLSHPTLKQTGVSNLELNNKDGLIIYSKSGNRILHTNIFIEDSKNIKLENLKFEELWEWDDETNAEFDRNDWDYITIKNSENIDIKKCEFSKAYDGIIDIKSSKNITTGYCIVNEIDIDNDEFFNKQFEELENNMDNYPMYQFLREEAKLDIQTIKKLSAYQFKLFLIGTKDNEGTNSNIVIHDSMFLNVKTRIPMARDSSIYLYNIYADGSKISEKILSEDTFEKIRERYPKFVSLSTHGVISLNRSYIVVENCIYNGYKHKYSIMRKYSLKSIGKIVKKNSKEELKDLKEKLSSIVGVQNYEEK